MNGYILSAGIISIIAFFIHAFMGDKEYKTIYPVDEETGSKKIISWIQGRCGWHWVSVDLFLCGVVLLLVSATNLLDGKKEIALLLGIYFFVTGLIWLATVLFSKTEGKQVILLGQWILCFLLSGLILFGRTTL